MADLNGPTSNEVEDHSDRRAELKTLIAQATSKYSVKDYDAAAELYSHATEMQAEINGEMAAKNADLLYAYGRCLYHAAVRNSDVLGSKVAGEKPQSGSEKPPKQGVIKDIVVAGHDGQAASGNGGPQTDGNPGGSSKSDDVQDQAGKPYFQFTGDEEFDESDEEGNSQLLDEDAGEAAEEEDDFANAFEMLDLARVLLLKRLQEEEGREGDTSWKDAEKPESVKQLKERLADTHDLQAEISLEGERFPNAVDDLQAALKLKMELYPEESSLIAEAHYKLSLALEFSSVTQQKPGDGENDGSAEVHMDEAMREESAKEMEAAIASCRQRISKEEANLRASEDTNGDQKEAQGTGKKVTQRDVDDVKEMVADMEQRVRLASPHAASRRHYPSDI